MLQAGTATASLILRDFTECLQYGVVVFAGVGNNGGDAYVVAAQLARAGVSVCVYATGAARTADARRAAALLPQSVPQFGPMSGTVSALAPGAVSTGAPMPRCAGLVVDGLLGTGHAGALRSEVREACDLMARFRAEGARVMALDIPTGLDATSGEIAEGSLGADCTVCYGTIKRGVLLQRGHVGRVVLADIGLGDFADSSGTAADDAAWRWYDRRAIAARTPAIAWNAHKGRRGRVLVVGGEEGMAGAAAFAARAALLAGAGVVHCMVDAPSVLVVQTLCEAALAHPWPERDGTRTDIAADALAVGPGLGRCARSGLVLRQLLTRYRTQPVVLDADALWHVADAAVRRGLDAAAVLAEDLRDVPQVVCTPHPGEFARLLGKPLPDDWDARAARLQAFVQRAGVTVLLKGAPTLVASPHDPVPTVVPHGTALLATGGSGDCLTGLIATLLAQGVGAHDAAVIGATVHGMAAEFATTRVGVVRGSNLHDLLDAIPKVWRSLGAMEATVSATVLATTPATARATAPVAAPYVIADLPAVWHAV